MPIEGRNVRVLRAFFMILAIGNNYDRFVLSFIFSKRFNSKVNCLTDCSSLGRYHIGIYTFQE